METYLQKVIEVPLAKLWPDPNNPRLALPEPPGYADKTKLFDPATRDEIFTELAEDAYAIKDLVDAIEGQGWMPIDNIIVWQHPEDADAYVVVEGNRRRVALQWIRDTELPKEEKKLERMKAKASTLPEHQIAEQQQLVDRLKTVVADTENLAVVPIAAATVEELERKLPRVLAVRHITGAKEWGNYAQDLYLLQRYNQLYNDAYPDRGFAWDEALIHRVADEASLTPLKTKRQLKAANWFSQFRVNWEDELPGDEEFQKTDYYLFEQIVRRPGVRQRLGVSEDAVALSPEAEEALFKWDFKHPRPGRADDNPNVFYRHENITLWDQMAKYDDENGTGFANRFDVENPDEAPTMREVEAAYLTHKAQRKPHAVIDDLLQRLAELTAEQLATEGQFFRAQLEQLQQHAERFLKMIDAAEAA